ncbi:unnamed protein product, partial [Mesorhabditis spiculigera]
MGTEKELPNVDLVVTPAKDAGLWEQIMEKCVRTEGWVFAPSDYSTWLDAFEEFYYYFALDKETKKAVGSLCFGRYDALSGKPEESLWAVGMYYVDPEYRGKGLGAFLFDKMMAKIGDDNAVLNGVLKMAPRYSATYGFDKILSEGDPHPYYQVDCKKLVVPARDEDVVTKDYREVSADEVDAWDRAEIMPGYDRSKYLRLLITSPEALTMVAYRDEKIVGLLCVRETGKKLSAGPFYADDMAVARTLVHDLLKRKEGWMDFTSFGGTTPSCCQMAKELFEELNNGEPCGHGFVYLQFTKELVHAAYEKTLAITDCAMSYV